MSTVVQRFASFAIALCIVLLTDPAAAAADPACELSAQIVRDAEKGVPKRWPFIITNGEREHAPPALAAFIASFQGEKPGVALARAYAEAREMGALRACPDLPRLANVPGALYGEAEEDRVVRPHGKFDTRYRAVILGLSRPVLSADGRTALVTISASCGSLCGNGGVALYHRDAAGAWRRVGYAPQWIS